MPETPIEKKLEIKDVLSLIDKANETFCYEVWVPSLNKYVMFREINTSQQKRLIKSIIDSPIYNTEFIFALHQIIKENCADNIDVGQLNIIDKLFISIAMRSVSISDTFEVEVVIDDKTTVKKSIILSELIKNIKDKVKLPESTTIQDDKGILSLTCGIPSILTEYKLERELRNTGLNRQSVDTPEQMRDAVGEAYITEIVKFITGLNIKSGDTINKIDFNTLDFSNRIKLLEKLPVKLVEKLIKYIDSVRQELDKVTLLKFDIEKDGKIETVERKLTVDGGFFTNSSA
jgi:hypothetical protein